MPHHGVLVRWDRKHAGRGEPMSIFETQEIHDAVTAVLRIHPAWTEKHFALVEVSTLGVGTKAALMRRSDRIPWEIVTIYTADHYTPGTAGVIVLGVW
jgi:hypothetical protein